MVSKVYFATSAAKRRHDSAEIWEREQSILAGDLAAPASSTDGGRFSMRLKLLAFSFMGFPEVAIVMKAVLTSSSSQLSRQSLKSLEAAFSAVKRHPRCAHCDMRSRDGRGSA
eukprot:3495981-Rhodomonas_salina.1